MHRLQGFKFQISMQLKMYTDCNDFSSFESPYVAHRSEFVFTVPFKIYCPRLLYYLTVFSISMLSTCGVGQFLSWKGTILNKVR